MGLTMAAPVAYRRGMAHHERPTKRANPSGKTVWVARWTDKRGGRRIGWPDRGIPGTYALKRDAQTAIDACYEAEEAAPLNLDTVGGYFAKWLKLHPRMGSTNQTYTYRIAGTLDIPADGVPLGEYQFQDLRRRHANELVGVLLQQGRTHSGVQGVIGSLSAMTEDAINDEVANTNPFRGVKVRATDPRITGRTKDIKVYSFEEMHRLAEAAGPYELQIRMLSDCGLRVSEVFPVTVGDVDTRNGILRLRSSVSGRRVLPGTKEDRLRGDGEAKGRSAPIPPTLNGMLARLLAEGPTPLRPDETLLFPTLRGSVWDYWHWRVHVYDPAREASGVPARPHELRHSFVSHMRAAGVPDAELAAITGHTVAVMVARYAHATRQRETFEDVRRAVG
jgi:integrase